MIRRGLQCVADRMAEIQHAAEPGLLLVSGDYVRLHADAAGQQILG